MVYFPTRKFVKVYNSPRTRELTDWCKSYATVTTTIGIQQVEEETNVFTAVREATRKDTVQSTPSHRQTRCTLLTIGTVVYILSFLEGILFHCYTQKKTCLKYVCKEQKKKKSDWEKSSNPAYSLTMRVERCVGERIEKHLVWSILTPLTGSTITVTS